MTYLRKILANLAEWDTGLWVHYSNLSMIKINPNQFHNDPSGIYLFPEKFKPIGNWRTYRYKHFVKLVSGIKILDFSDLSTPESCFDFLQKIGITLNDKYVDKIKNSENPADIMWEQLVQKFLGKPAKFNAAIRKAGYDAIFDDTKSIHTAEVQLLVFDPTKVKLVKTEDRKQSGFLEMNKAIEILKDICEGYGAVDVTKPKKSFDRYEQQNVLESRLECKGKKCEANWKITAAGSMSDSWTGEKKQGERKPKNPPHSKVNAHLSFSEPRLGYGAGADVDVTNPNWDKYKDDIKRTMDAIWQKGGER